jgi:arylsulfatase A-like enzyme
MGIGGRLLAGNDVYRYQTVGGVWRACATREKIPGSILGRMRYLYGRSIKALDDWLSRLLEELDRRRLLDDTLVIVTSDHGENLGESNLIGHAFSLDERLIHVPLVVSQRGAFSTNGAMSLTAMPRLIAETLGLSDTPWDNDADPQGIVVSQYDALTTRSDPRVEQAAAAWGLDDEAIEWVTSRGTAATDGTLKLVRQRDRDQLYDLRNDPQETSPLDPAGAPEALRFALEAAERQGSLIEPVRGTGNALPAESEAENAELEQRLKLLGYL